MWVHVFDDSTLQGRASVPSWSCNIRRTPLSKRVRACAQMEDKEWKYERKRRISRQTTTCRWSRETGWEIWLYSLLFFRLPLQHRRLLGIPRNERIFTICDCGEVGDEFHYLLNCSNESVQRNRTKYVDKYYTYHSNVPKFCSLMNMTSKSKNVKLY